MITDKSIYPPNYAPNQANIFGSTTSFELKFNINLKIYKYY